MKKIILVLLSAIAITLTSCSAPMKTEISPYKLTDNERYILSCFDLEHNSQMLEFTSPEGTKKVDIDILNLKDGEWESIGGGAIGAENSEGKAFKGVFAMKINKDFSIDFTVSYDGGRYSSGQENLDFDGEFQMSVNEFLRASKEIELNKAVPVAILAYEKGMSMASFSLNNYFDLERLKDIDFVRAVTLTFSDEEM